MNMYTPPENQGQTQEGDAMERVACTCSSCGCDESATGKDDSGNDSCDECSDYYVDDDGDVVCSRTQDAVTCRHCGVAIEWGHIQTGASGVANWREGSCGCEGREWTETEQGPGNTWGLAESATTGAADDDE